MFCEFVLPNHNERFDLSFPVHYGNLDIMSDIEHPNNGLSNGFFESGSSVPTGTGPPGQHSNTDTTPPIHMTFDSMCEWNMPGLDLTNMSTKFFEDRQAHLNDKSFGIMF